MCARRLPIAIIIPHEAPEKRINLVLSLVPTVFLLLWALHLKFLSGCCRGSSPSGARICALALRYYPSDTTRLTLLEEKVRFIHSHNNSEGF